MWCLSNANHGKSIAPLSNRARATSVSSLSNAPPDVLPYCLCAAARLQSKHSSTVAIRCRARGARCARQVGGNISEDNLQFTLAANAFSNLSLLFADNGVNILVRVGKRIHWFLVKIDLCHLQFLIHSVRVDLKHTANPFFKFTDYSQSVHWERCPNNQQFLLRLTALKSLQKVQQKSI